MLESVEDVKDIPAESLFPSCRCDVKPLIPSYRFRSDVDNQLAMLHNGIRSHFHTEIWNRKYQTMHPLKLKVLDEKLKYPVLYQENIVPIKLARQARKFARAIPFDLSTPQLNDTDNPPREDIYNKIRNKDLVRAALDHPSNNPKNWIWENYACDIWRAVPLTLEDFCGSPIYELIRTLEARWWHWLPNKSLRPMTWVLQRVPTGCGVGFHNDEWHGRRIAFVYYLTPTHWDGDIHGGYLHIDNEPYSGLLHPKFNSMVAWHLKSEYDPSIIGSPLHAVEKVIAGNKYPRIALVGFWCD